MSKKSKKNTVNTVMNKEENVMSKKNVAAVSVSKGEVHKLSVCVDDVVVMTNVVSVPTDSALKKVKMCIEFDLADIVNSDTVTAEPVEAVNNVVAVAEQTEQVVVDEPEVVVPQAITALAVVPNTESEKNNVVTIKAADMLNSDEKTYFVKSLNNIIKALVAAGCENDEVPFDTTNEEIEATETPVAEVTKTKMVTEEQEHGLRFLEKTANQYCVGLTEVIKNKLAGKNDNLLGQIETFVFNLTYKKFGSLFSKYVDKQYAGLFCNLTDDDAYNDVFNAFEQLGVNFFEDGEYIKNDFYGNEDSVDVRSIVALIDGELDKIVNNKKIDEKFNKALSSNSNTWMTVKRYVIKAVKSFCVLSGSMDTKKEESVVTEPVDNVEPTVVPEGDTVTDEPKAEKVKVEEESSVDADEQSADNHEDDADETTEDEVITLTDEQKKDLMLIEAVIYYFYVAFAGVISADVDSKSNVNLYRFMRKVLLDGTIVRRFVYRSVIVDLYKRYMPKHIADLFDFDEHNYCSDGYKVTLAVFEKLGIELFKDGVRVEHCGVSSDVAVNTVDVFLNNSKDAILNDESFSNQLKAASSFGDYRQYIADITKKFIKLIADMFSSDDEDGEKEDVIPTIPVDPVIEKTEEVAPQAPATTEESATLVVSADGSNQFMFHGFMVEGGYEEEEGVIPVNPASSPEAPIHKDAPSVTPATEESVVPAVKKAEGEMDMSKFAIPLNDAAKNASKKTVKKETKNGEANQTKETTTSTPKSAKTVSGGNTANDAEVDTSVIHITPLASDREILVRYKDRNNMPFNKVNLEVSDYEDGKKYRNYNLSHAIVDTLQSIINNSKLNKNCKVVVIHTGAFYVDKAFHDPSIVWDTLLGKREPKSDVARKYRKDFIDFTKKLSDMGITVLCNVPNNIDA